MQLAAPRASHCCVPPPRSGATRSTRRCRRRSARERRHRRLRSARSAPALLAARTPRADRTLRRCRPSPYRRRGLLPKLVADYGRRLKWAVAVVVVGAEGGAARVLSPPLTISTHSPWTVVSHGSCALYLYSYVLQTTDQRLQMPDLQYSMILRSIGKRIAGPGVQQRGAYTTIQRIQRIHLYTHC